MIDTRRGPATRFSLLAALNIGLPLALRRAPRRYARSIREAIDSLDPSASLKRGSLSYCRALRLGVGVVDRYGPAAARLTWSQEQALSGRSVVLVGMMGAGKTSVGKRLATNLEWPGVDADAEIEAGAQLSLAAS